MCIVLWEVLKLRSIILSKTKLQKDIHYRVLAMVEANPTITQRALAKALGVSLGRINYGLRALIDKGLIKVIQFEVTRAWEKSCCSPQNAFQFLSKKNFTIFQINNGKLEELKLNNLPNFTIFSNFIAVNRSVVDN